MKLLVQADDYAISPAVSQGIRTGIQEGLIRNTGVFVNMPWSRREITRLLELQDKTAIGIDLNLTTGTPILPCRLLPTLTDEEGSFLSSWESRRRDNECGHCHANLDEVKAEMEAQLLTFIEWTGRKPDYIHSHAYTTPEITAAQRALAEKYGIPYTSDVWQKYFQTTVDSLRIPWYIKPATLDNQLKSSLKDHILQEGPGWLAQDYHLLVGHMGYVDAELCRLSSYSLLRAKDLEGVCDPEVKAWMQENAVELISYKDLP